MTINTVARNVKTFARMLMKRFMDLFTSNLPDPDENLFSGWVEPGYPRTR